MQKARNYLENILQLKNIENIDNKHKEYFARYITTFNIKTTGSNIEPEIIEALSKHADTSLYSLELAIKLNQIDKLKELVRKARVRYLVKNVF